jgi:hypothetical protein
MAKTILDTITIFNNKTFIVTVLNKRKAGAGKNNCKNNAARGAAEHIYKCKVS